jgi:hypothetical protein
MSPSSFHRSGSSSSDDLSDELYAFDESVRPRRSHRSRRRSSSVSFNSRPTVIGPNVSPYHHGTSMPIPINQPTYSHSGGSPYQPGGSPYQPGGSPYHPGGSPYQHGGSPYQPGSSPYQPGGSPYSAPGNYSQQYPGVPVVGTSYDPNQALLYQNQNPASYPQQTYIQAQPGMNQGVPMPPGSTIVIQQPPQHSSRHKRHHKHRSGSRHRSHSDVYPVY